MGVLTGSCSLGPVAPNGSALPQPSLRGLSVASREIAPSVGYIPWVLGRVSLAPSYVVTLDLPSLVDFFMIWISIHCLLACIVSNENILLTVVLYNVPLFSDILL